MNKAKFREAALFLFLFLLGLMFCVGVHAEGGKAGGGKKKSSATSRNDRELEGLLRTENLDPASEAHGRILELLGDRDGTSVTVCLRAARFGGDRVRATTSVGQARMALDFMEAVAHARYEAQNIQDFTARNMIEFLKVCVADNESGRPRACRNDMGSENGIPAVADYLLRERREPGPGGKGHRNVGGHLNRAQARAANEASEDVINGVIELAETKAEYEPYVVWLESMGLTNYAEKIRNERLDTARRELLR
ncbi:MAG: hypothetical protein HYT79_08830 [Elusimicrobia bacterium]|nr:hypothetical protein [Elusimicrobiota bacterium]